MAGVKVKNVNSNLLIITQGLSLGLQKALMSLKPAISSTKDKING